MFIVPVGFEFKSRQIAMRCGSKLDNSISKSGLQNGKGVFFCQRGCIIYFSTN